MFVIVELLTVLYTQSVRALCCMICLPSKLHLLSYSAELGIIINPETEKNFFQLPLCHFTFFPKVLL